MLCVWCLVALGRQKEQLGWIPGALWTGGYRILGGGAGLQCERWHSEGTVCIETKVRVSQVHEQLGLRSKTI